MGFIRKLPPAIVTAFRATLEELEEASLLVHVVDMSSHNAAEQCQTVEEILAELGVADKPRITALNKIDLLLEPGKRWTEETATEYLSETCRSDDDNTVLISAGKKWGLAKLIALISRLLPDQTV